MYDYKVWQTSKWFMRQQGANLTLYLVPDSCCKAYDEATLYRCQRQEDFDSDAAYSEVREDFFCLFWGRWGEGQGEGRGGWRVYGILLIILWHALSCLLIYSLHPSPCYDAIYSQTFIIWCTKTPGLILRYYSVHLKEVIKCSLNKIWTI